MNVARITQEYISQHPSVKDCVRKGLINYSALAREICKEEDTDSFHAVLIACQRYSRRVRNQQTVERRIKNILRRTKMQISTKMATVILEKPRDYERLFAMQRASKREGETFQLIDGKDAVVVICGNDGLTELRESFRERILKSTPDVVQISMTFPENIETTPGVVAHIYGLLAEHGINVLEEMSCWTELLLVLDGEDLPKALRVLKFS